MSHSNIAPALFVSLVAWRVYLRARRNIGRQHFRQSRQIASIVIFGLLSAGISVFLLRDLPALEGFGMGLAGGLLVGWVSLRLTRYEATEKGHFYIPNPYIGIAVSLLLVGRVVYRFTSLYMTRDVATRSTQLELNPLTVGLFGLMAGYYITHAVGLIAHFSAEKKAAVDRV